MKAAIVILLELFIMVAVCIPLALVIIKRERSSAPWLISAYWLYTNSTLLVAFIVENSHPSAGTRKTLEYFINFQNNMSALTPIGIISFCTEYQWLKKSAAVATGLLFSFLLAFILSGRLDDAGSLPMITLSVSIGMLFQLAWLFTHYNKVKNNFSDNFLLMQNMSFLFNSGAFIIPCFFFYALKYTRHHPVDDLLILVHAGTLCSLLICITAMARYLPISLKLPGSNQVQW